MEKIPVRIIVCTNKFLWVHNLKTHHVQVGFVILQLKLDIGGKIKSC